MTGPLLTPVIEHRAFVPNEPRSSVPTTTTTTTRKTTNMNEKDFSVVEAESDEVSPDEWDSGTANEHAGYNVNIDIHSATMDSDLHAFQLLGDATLNIPFTMSSDMHHTEITSPDTLNQTLDDPVGTSSLKRERNRLAARRCRQKQRDRISILEKDVRDMESANDIVEREIQMLQIQAAKLTDILLNHKCVIKFPQIPQTKFPSMAITPQTT